MAYSRAQYRNFTRDLVVNVRGLNASAASQAIARAARERVALVEQQQAARSGGTMPDHISYVDGRQDSRFESVKPDGVILLQWHYLTEAVIRVVDHLLVAGPEQKGDWKDSVQTFVGDDLVPRSQRLPADATEATVVVRADYARRLEVGKRDSGGPFVLQVPMHFVEESSVALKPVLRRLGWQPRFTYVSLADGFGLSAAAMRRRHFGERGIRTEKSDRKIAGSRERETTVRYPAIVITKIRNASL